jgi:hypothetical protein
VNGLPLATDDKQLEETVRYTHCTALLLLLLSMMAVVVFVVFVCLKKTRVWILKLRPALPMDNMEVSLQGTIPVLTGRVPEQLNTDTVPESARELRLMAVLKLRDTTSTEEKVGAESRLPALGSTRIKEGAVGVANTRFAMDMDAAPARLEDKTI